MRRADIAALRKVSVSQGIMLETRVDAAVASGAGRISARPTRCRPCGSRRSRLAGEQRVPFTTGILIGIGETRRERIEALLALRDLHERYGHIQEIIIQNFRAEARHAHGGCAGSRRSTSISGRSRWRGSFSGRR